jgi:hypothetical protein
LAKAAKDPTAVNVAAATAAQVKIDNFKVEN